MATSGDEIHKYIRMQTTLTQLLQKAKSLTAMRWSLLPSETLGAWVL